MSDFTKSIGKPVGIAVGVVLVAGLVWFLFGDRLKRTLGAVGDAVNPTSDQNIFFRGTNAVGAALTGDQGFSLGSWIYDLTHADANLASNPRPKTADEVSWWNNLTSKISGG